MLLLPSYEGGRVERLAFTADGRWLASVATHPRRQFRDAPVRLWNRLDGKQLYTQPVPGHYGRCLALAGDGSVSAWEATTTRDRIVCLWDTYSASERITFPAFVYDRPVALSGDGSTLAMIDQSNTLHVRSAYTGVERVGVPYATHYTIRAIGFPSHGRWVAFGSSLGITLVNVESHHEEAQLEERSSVFQLACSPDGSLIAVRLADGSISAWDRARRRRIWNTEGPQREYTSLAFAPDNRTLAASAADGSATFWDATDGRELRRYQWDIGALGALAFAPDGLTCAAGGEEGRIVIWDLDD